MVPCIEVFCEVIGQVFLAWVPRNIEITERDLIYRPKEVLFHSP
jgi:hypothetical protein